MHLIYRFISFYMLLHIDGNSSVYWRGSLTFSTSWQRCLNQKDTDHKVNRSPATHMHDSHRPLSCEHAYSPLLTGSHRRRFLCYFRLPLLYLRSKGICYIIRSVSFANYSCHTLKTQLELLKRELHLLKLT